MKTIVYKICIVLIASACITSCCKEDFVIPGETSGSYVFVSCADADSISVIDSETMKQVAQLTGADIQVNSYEPRNSAITSDHKTVFVPCRHSNNVLVIDANSHTITHNITHESFYEPYAVAVTADDKEAWVANKEGGDSNTGTISIINVSSNSVTSSIVADELESPEGICIAAGKAYVANRQGGTVSVFNVNSQTFIKNIDVGGEPRYAVSSTDGSFVYVTSVWGGLAKINTAVDTVTSVIEAYGRNAAISPDGSKVFVASQSSTIHMVSTANDQVTDITVPDAYSIYAVAIMSNGELGFATDEDKDVVYVFNPSTGTLLNNGIGIRVGSTPRGIVAQ